MSSVLEDKDAIRELVARYCFAIDDARYDEWADCFASSGTFEVAGMFKIEGRAAIRSFADSIPRNQRGLPGFKHCTLNQIIEVEGDRAAARCYLLLVHEGNPLEVQIAGRYEDTLVKERGRWLFASRAARFDYQSLPAR
jgi:3-phenylpropionate/cinnamic acid dioxygenase small subunit